MTDVNSIKEELSSVPFGDLLKLKDKMGTKKFNEAYASAPPTSGVRKKTFKRDNKNRPMEISSKRRVKGGGSSLKSQKVNDPRFDERAGEYNERIFQQSYGFVDSLRQREKAKAERKLAKVGKRTGGDEKADEERQRLKKELDSATQREKTSEDRKRREKVTQAVRKEERKKVADGKTPYYAKRSEVKAATLEAKFNELKESGKLEQYLKKKRKKNASKDRKALGSVRTRDGAV